MGKRRKKSGSIIHKRNFLTNAKATRGKPWRKVEDMLAELKREHGYKAMSLEIFNLLWKLQRDNGWSGNAVTQYAWNWYQKHGYSLTEYGLMEHIDGTEFGLWLLSQQSKWKREKVAKRKRVKVTSSKEDRRIGDEYRAKQAAMAEGLAKSAELFYVKNDTIDIWRLIAKGMFPLGEALFTQELERRATLRAELKAAQ